MSSIHSINLYIVSRHYSWHIRPSVKCVAYFFRSLKWHNFCTISNSLNIIYFTIDIVSNSIVVYFKYGIQSYISCRHCRRNLSPTNEGVTLFHRLLGQCRNCFTVNNSCCCKLFVVSKICNDVAVYFKLGCQSYVSCRHCRRNLSPTNEGVTLFHRLLGQCRNCFTVNNSCCCKLFVVSKICNDVAVYFKLGIQSYIACRHCRRNLTPTNEGVTLFHRLLFQCRNCFTVNNSCCCELFVVNKICNSIAVYCKLCIQCYIFGWHCSWNFTPAFECMTCFYRLIFQCWNLCTISNGCCCELLTVNKVCNSVVVYSKCTLNYYITCRHCSRNCAPTAESVTILCRSSHRSNSSTATKLLS